MDFSLLKKAKRGGFILHRTRGVDVERGAHVVRGTRTDATWHTRPCGRAAQAHAAPRWREVGRMRGRATRVHVDARMAPCGMRGGWHVKSPWVSGPWLDNWGGNANALRRPRLYTHLLLSFSPCGTMFPLTLLRRDMQ